MYLIIEKIIDKITHIVKIWSTPEVEKKILNELPILFEKEKEKEKKEIKYGLAFPVTIGINDIVAHWTPRINDPTYFTKDDLIKVDFGFQWDGYLIDSAFSYSQLPFCEEIIKVSKEATDIGIKMCKVDQNIFEIGEEIGECIENHEIIDEKGKLQRLRSIYDLCGHSIDRYHLHSGQMIPNYKIPILIQEKIRPELRRIQEGYSYAVETFPTNGSNNIVDDEKINFIQQCFMFNNLYHKNGPTKEMLKIPEIKFLWDEYGTFSFCQRHIIKDTFNKGLHIPVIFKGLKEYEKYWNVYPPLKNISENYSKIPIYVAQIEKNVWIDPIQETSIILT